MPGVHASMGCSFRGLLWSIQSPSWMLPVCNHHEWKNRSLETTGFMDYVSDLASWAGLGSNAFPYEILSALKEPREISWDRMSEGQVTRSIRLLWILKAAFANHPRALILKNYEEARGRHRCSGYEALAMLTSATPSCSLRPPDMALYGHFGN